MCRHCGARKVARPRGLCWPCYYLPAVRDRYPASTSKFNNRGWGQGMWTRPLPAEPTTAKPGTPEKFAVLMERAMAEVQLWHPDDATD